MRSAADELLALHQGRARAEVTHLLPALAGSAQGGEDPGRPGRRLFVRELSPRGRAEWLAANQKDEATSDARLVIACLVDEQGEAVFTRAHLPALAGDETGAAWLCRLAQAAARVSGLLWREGDSLGNGQPTSPSTGPPPGGG